ncbi:hypothetical protein SPAB_05388 [Salmonella enterica subsp. enterica serovar Paratyphi B str. SPB7]|uniref:Uncharacterized protein n=1 Tax=Salmonella paratyphi B (strain ATCC BAA-1250 / SPB7) TaxID=1016998 RepID=A0A6C6ZAY4_SALPB|nr:hypothetical protein SPAB_05388 [Salmonella enterica subsp. enterica serovar Paratyphi B str. SPB7]
MVLFRGQYEKTDYGDADRCTGQGFYCLCYFYRSATGFCLSRCG